MIKLVYSILTFILFFISFSCQNSKEESATIPNVTASTKEAKPITIQQNETPSVNYELPISKKQYNQRIQKHTIEKDSLNELKSKYVINDAIIDSLNLITPLFDKTIYNKLAVSYFSALSDSLHGRSYFADNSNEVMLSIMEILTSRINEGTDIVFLIDKTGSMDDDISMVKNNLNMIMDYLSHFNNVKIGMAFYGDKNYHYDLWYNKINLTTNTNDIRRFMETYSTIGNPDVAESVNDGIVKTVEEMNWTPNNRRLMLVIGDAQSQSPPYSNYNQTQVIHKCDSMNVKFNLYPIILSSKQIDIETIYKNQDFVNVYPNPANDYCHLKLSGLETTYYEIKDLTGRNIISANANGSDITIPVFNLPNGNYLIQVFNNDYSKFYSEKLIVSH